MLPTATFTHIILDLATEELSRESDRTHLVPRGSAEIAEQVTLLIDQCDVWECGTPQTALEICKLPLESRHKKREISQQSSSHRLTLDQLWTAPSQRSSTKFAVETQMQSTRSGIDTSLG